MYVEEKSLCGMPIAIQTISAIYQTIDTQELYTYESA